MRCNLPRACPVSADPRGSAAKAAPGRTRGSIDCAAGGIDCAGLATAPSRLSGPCEVRFIDAVTLRRNAPTTSGVASSVIVTANSAPRSMNFCSTKIPDMAACLANGAYSY